jgi:hypothetical protein
MDHTSLNYLVVLLVFGPLVVFFIKYSQLSRQLPQEIAAESDSGWKDPEPLLVSLPFDVVCKSVAEELPNYSYANGSWQIINIEDGIPTTIAANLPCLDESDPNNAQRFDLGLLTTIFEQGPPGQFTTVKMHFIPYEGLDSTLQLMGENTYRFIEKALRAKSGASVSVNAVSSNQLPGRSPGLDYTREPAQVEPPSAVPPEITFPASSGSPYEPASDFFAQSTLGNNRVFDQDPPPAPDPEPPAYSTAALEPFAFPEPLPMSALMPEPERVPEPTAVPSPVIVPTLMPGPGTGDTANLCPGCSQPINPSFPFCLYCGKNF